MRIKRYASFLEDLAVSANDSPAMKMSKQSVKADEKYIADYNAKKDALTRLYTDVDANGEFKNDDVRLKEELEKMLGKEEQSEGADRNPLLQELAIVLDLQRQLATEQRRTNSEKSRLDETTDEAVDEEGPRKDELNKRAEEMKSKVTDGVAKIADLNKRTQEARMNFDKKMEEFEKQLKKSTDDIKKAPLK